MENTGTPPIYDKAANSIPKNIGLSTSQEIALICRLTFKGVEDLLKTGKVRDISYESVLAVEVALNRIDDEYSNLKLKGGVENEILTDIKAIEDDLNEALAQISAAATRLDKTDPKYHKAVIECRQSVEAINTKIAGFADIEPKGIDSR